MSEAKMAGVDIWSGFLKVVSKENTIVFPFVTRSHAESKPEVIKENDHRRIEVEYDGVRSPVDESDIPQTTYHRQSLSIEQTNDIITTVTILTGLALVSEEKEPSFIVVTGIPVKDFALFRQTYIDTFSGRHTITVNGEEKTLHVEEVVVLPLQD